MPEPSLASYALDYVNTNIGLAYIQDTNDFASMKAFDILPTTARMGQYIAYEPGAFMRDAAQPFGDSEETSGSGYTFAREPYFCEPFGHHKDIGDITRGMAESFIQTMPQSAASLMTPEAVATIFVTRILMLRLEKFVMGRFFVPGVWGTTLDSAAADFTPWNAGTNATIQADILAGKRTMLTKTGFEPNSLLLSYDAFQAAALDPKIQQRFQFTSPDSLTVDMLARYLQLAHVYVAKAVEAISDPSAAVYETAFIPGDRVLLYYRPDNPGPMQPASAYTFAWTWFSQGLNEIMGVSSYFINFRATTRVEGKMAIDSRIVGADLGLLFDNVAPQAA